MIPTIHIATRLPRGNAFEASSHRLPDRPGRFGSIGVSGDKTMFTFASGTNANGAVGEFEHMGGGNLKYTHGGVMPVRHNGKVMLPRQAVVLSDGHALSFGKPGNYRAFVVLDQKGRDLDERQIILHATSQE